MQDVAILGKVQQILNKPSGVNWAEKSFTFGGFGTSGTHESTTILDITGSGYLSSIIQGVATSRTISIQIDGGTIYTYTRSTQYEINFFPIRFNSRLIIKANGTSMSAGVVLD